MSVRGTIPRGRKKREKNRAKPRKKGGGQVRRTKKRKTVWPRKPPHFKKKKGGKKKKFGARPGQERTGGILSGETAAPRVHFQEKGRKKTRKRLRGGENNAQQRFPSEDPCRQGIKNTYRRGQRKTGRSQEKKKKDGSLGERKKKRP